MTKFFCASEKKLKKRYNRNLFFLNILPLAILLTLAAVIFAGRKTPQPLSYYYALIIILTCTVGYSFFSVWVGSLIMTRLLEGHTKHTYVQILNRHLVVSRYTQTQRQDGKPVIYKKLWIIRLTEIEDIYYYKRNVIVVAPARTLHEQADWLTYSHDRNGVRFDNWWYDTNGGRRCGGVEIHDMFLNSRRVARTIQNASGRMLEKDAQRKQFRERMLEISKSVR